MQKRFAAAIMTPLTPQWAMSSVAPDGKAMNEYVAAFIKPNDRLDSFQRIELYNKQYWYRLIDIMYEDYPGVAALLGQRQFNRFCEAYLQKYPSRSGLLRNLGRHIVQFIQESPETTAPRTEMASDMARFEWAQVEAFDAEDRPRLTADDLLGKDPAKTSLRFHPSVTLLELNHAVDQLLLAVKKESFRGEASNASEGPAPTSARRRSARRQRVHILVYRHDNSVYTRRLEAEEFLILQSLYRGGAIAAAIEAATPVDADEVAWPTKVRESFRLWMALGLFCR